MEIPRLWQPYDNLALTFPRFTQPCDHPLQGAHNLAKIVSCITLHDGCKVVHDGCKVVMK